MGAGSKALEIDMRQDRHASSEHGADEAKGHEQQQHGEEGVDASDDHVDGHDGGADVIGKDDGRPDPQRNVGHACQQRRRPGHKYSADQDEEEDGVSFHEAADFFAEVAADHFRIGSTAIAQRNHACNEVMHCTGKNAAKDDPEQRGRTVECAHNGAEHRAKAGNVEQLDEEDLPAGQNDVVHAVGFGAYRSEPFGINFEDFFNKDAINGVPQDE